VSERFPIGVASVRMRSKSRSKSPQPDTAIATPETA
jgi:hypothetical protein